MMLKKILKNILIELIVELLGTTLEELKKLIEEKKKQNEGK